MAPACALLAVSSLFAQKVNSSSAATPSSPDQAGAATTQETVNMSPFEVQASAHDSGYFAENTLAGSRLNTNIGDLASSITVVTKQQLVNTSSLDINDIFMYEANTEGANTYTPMYLNRGYVRDVIGGYSADGGQGFGAATANRVRGLDVADTSQNNYPTIARIPFDAYNTNSVEINRGPNSLLFGTGSPAGIVNQSTAPAALRQRSMEVIYRFGSFGAYRVSLNINQPLGDKLAINAAALYDSRGFERKPSYDIYRRQYATLTYQPFKSTRLTASYEHFNNRNNRPNYEAPIDYTTPWLQAGRPGYNPVTDMVTIMDTGKVLGPYVTSTADPHWVPGSIGNSSALTSNTSPWYVPGIAYESTHNHMLIDQGAVLGFYQGSPQMSTLSRPTPPNLTAAQWDAYRVQWTISGGFVTPTPPASTGATAYATWYGLAITNPSLYDWTSTNAQSVNYGSMNANTYNVELQQQILPGLNLDLGWFRQELSEWDNYPLGQANQAVRFYVDTNTVRVDGTPNPYFGSPFVYDYQVFSFYEPEINNVFRAVLAYEKDFTKNKGWTRWLGSWEPAEGQHQQPALWSGFHRRRPAQLAEHRHSRLDVFGQSPALLLHGGE
jgi:outer membrane receptor protein involved in Fe transport